MMCWGRPAAGRGVREVRLRRKFLGKKKKNEHGVPGNAKAINKIDFY